MTIQKKYFVIAIISCFVFINVCVGQQSPAFSSAVERLFNKIESDILSSAEAMPENKSNFTPESLHIKSSEFKGVRSFAGQIKHLATDNFHIWSPLTGDALRADITNVNGPATIKKNQILSST